MLTSNYGMTHAYTEPTIFISPVRATSEVLSGKKSISKREIHPIQPIINWDETAQQCGAQIIKEQTLDCLKNYPSLEPHVRMMYERLDFAQRSLPNVKLPPPFFMVGNSLLRGPAFTNEWSDDLKLARFKWMNMVFNSPPEEPLKMDPIKGPYSTYLPHHFIFWNEGTDDVKYMFDSVPESHEEALEELRLRIESLSSTLLSDDEILQDPPPEFIFRPVATGSFTGTKITPEWETELDDPYGDLEEEIMIAARSIAPKRPGETREIGILKPGSLRFHRRIMWNMQRAVSRIPGCPHGKNEEFLDSIVRRIGRKGNFFYMRDYTKSGMTIPHAVIQAICEGFWSRRPEMGQKAARFFTDQQLFMRDGSGGEYELNRPLTGSPLGMFVEGFTLLQYAIFEHVLDNINFKRSAFEFSATNDDMVVGSGDPQAINSFNECDVRFNSELGMAYKDTKSGISWARFVFCEKYWDRDHIVSKERLFAGSIIGANQTYNAFHAKEYIYSVMLSAGECTPLMEQAVREVQSRIGPEFHEDEYNWPLLFGGWLPCIKGGVDHSITWYDGDLRAIAGYWANRQRLKRHPKLGGKPLLAIGRKFNMTLVAEPEHIKNWVDLVPFLGTKRTLERHYRRSYHAPKVVAKEYEKLAQIRLQTYLDITKGKLEAPNVLEGYLERHPNTYILDTMPYIKTESCDFYIIKPRYGMRDISLYTKLASMQHKGWISVNSAPPIPLSSTAILLADHGITERCQMPRLHFGDSGVSAWILANQPRGYLEWCERTNRVITSVNDDDAPFKPTAGWRYFPHNSLLNVTRWYTALKQRYQHEPTDEDWLWAAEASRVIAKEDQTEFLERENECTDAVLDSVLAHQIRDVIRDWVPNADEVIAEMRGRIIPLNPDSRPKEYDHLISLQTNDPFRLLPTEEQPEGIDSDGASDHSGAVFDPWAELGV